MWNGHLEYLDKSFQEYQRLMIFQSITGTYERNDKYKKPKPSSMAKHVFKCKKRLRKQFFNKDTYYKDIMEDVQSLIK